MGKCKINYLSFTELHQFLKVYLLIQQVYLPNYTFQVSTRISEKKMNKRWLPNIHIDSYEIVLSQVK